MPSLLCSHTLDMIPPVLLSFFHVLYSYSLVLHLMQLNLILSGKGERTRTPNFRFGNQRYSPLTTPLATTYNKI